MLTPNLYWKCEPCGKFHHIMVENCSTCNGIGFSSPKVPSPKIPKLRPTSPDESVQPNGNLPSKPPVKSYTRNTRNTATSVATKVEIDTDEPVIERLRQEIKDEKPSIQDDVQAGQSETQLNEYEKMKNFVKSHCIDIVCGISVFVITFGMQ